MTRTEAERPISIIRGGIDSLTFYEVTEDELDILENGPASSTFLNIAIALLSISLSFFTTIFTVDLKSKIVIFIVFLIIAIMTLLGGVGYLITWYRGSKSYKSIVTRIKARAEKPVVIVDEIKDSITLEESEDQDIKKY